MAEFFGKNIPLAMGFDLGAKRPLDARTVVNTFSELQTHNQGGRVYPGLVVYVIDEDENYQWTGVEWEKFGRGAGGGNNFVVPNYESINSSIQSEGPVKGSLIYVESDMNKAGDANMYIITEELYSEEEKLYKPLTVVALSTFAKSQVPTLSYSDAMPEGTVIYKNKEDNVTVQFMFTSDNYGDGQYKIYRDGSLISSVSSSKGNVIIDLGPMSSNGTYELSITASDYFGIPAPQTLKFKLIVGGLELTSTFDKTLEGAIYEIGDVVEFPFIATVSDKTKQINMYYKVTHENAGSREYTVKTGMADISTKWEIPNLDLRGLYTLEVQAYTGESINDTSEGSFISNKLEYKFNILADGEIAIFSEFTKQPSIVTHISIPFRVVGKDDSFFWVTGYVQKKQSNGTWVEVIRNDEGVQAPRNVSTFWAIGKLELGTYRYVLRAWSSDRTKPCLVDATAEFDVVEVSFTSVQPVKTNLLCWFDANEKRNTDTNRNVWTNHPDLGDTYRVNLHGLNYASNGWKHIEGKSDDSEGEFVLKFTGDSYGELVKVYGGGVTERYSPFSIFKLGENSHNDGQLGITIETAIKTHCIGELNAKVLTCMEGSTLNTPGCAITYDMLYLNSDQQETFLQFMEDEWIHVAFVVDKDIRTLDTIGGQAKIENLNQTYSMRIYINGVLCSCSAFTKDIFLDKSFNAFPLLLNGCITDTTTGDVGNFGECEMKFLRIYNGILTSEQVLNNYIAHIFDPEKQQQMKDRNDTSIVSLPKIVFRRDGSVNNATTFNDLHVITDKKISKKTFVSCIMEFHEVSGKVHQFYNTDVYLQGTSSLQYPVKNYQVKHYDKPSDYSGPGKRKKEAFVPPGKEDWPCGCYTYTLKVDYMEQSHNNNTPTAVFYDEVVDAVTGGNASKMSPAKRKGYKDAIDGFPCIVYYDNSDGKGEVLVGSFMFNVHKDGDQLGFDVEVEDDEGNPIENVCVSYEATANSSDTAGCFFRLSASIGNVYKYTVDGWWREYLKEHNISEKDLTVEQFQAKINNGELDYQTFDEFKESYTEMDYIMGDFEARYSYSEHEEESDDWNEETYRPAIDLVNWVYDSTTNKESEHYGKFRADFEKHFSLEYMLAYYLQMQVFAQVDNCGKNSMWDTWDGKKFYPRPYDMDTQMGLSNTGTETIESHAELIPEISPTMTEGILTNISNSDTETELRYMSFNTKTSLLWNNFAKEFKNEIKNTYIQLRSNGVYSVENITSKIFAMTIDKIGEIYYNKDAGSKYLAVTTAKGSEFLKALHGNRQQKYKRFLTDRLTFLDTVYEYYYDSETHPDTLNGQISLRSDATVTETIQCHIGISTYSPQYVKVSVGSGQDAIVVGYVGPKSKYIDPNTNMEMEGTLFSIPIKASDKEVIIYGAGNIKKINRLESLNVRDVTLDQAEKIVELNLSGSSRMSGLTLGNNKYLRSLDCSYSYLLGDNGKALELRNCPNLQYLDLSYTSKLSGINFPENSNLKEVILRNCGMTDVNIQGAEFLTKVDITNCTAINGFTLNKCPKMDVINISGTSVKAFAATNCTALLEVNASNCNQMTSLDLSLSDKVYKLNFSSNSSPVLNDLKLTTVYSLRELYVNNSASLGILRLPKYLNDEEAQKAANGNEAAAKIWNLLEVLNISNSSIYKLQYGMVDEDHSAVNMGQLKNLTTLGINNCTAITEILDLNFTTDKSLNSMFANNYALQKISGLLKTSSTSAAYLFSSCRSLNNITGLTFSFSNMQNLNYAFSRCFKATTAMLKKLLDAAGSNLTDIGAIAHCPDQDCVFGTAADRPERDLPSDLLINCPNVRQIWDAFSFTHYRKIPGDLFGDINSTNPNKVRLAQSIINLEACFAYPRSSRTDVGYKLLQNKPNLTNVARMFSGNTGLKNYFNSSEANGADIFLGSPNITSTRFMFYNCPALVHGPHGWGEMFKPLKNISNMSYMFDGCKSLTADIPDGILSSCTNVINISGLFRNCTGLVNLPGSIFREKPSDINVKFEKLTNAYNVFAGCSNLTGIVSRHFFHGAENLRNVGGKSGDRFDNTNNYYPNEGFFYNTNLTGYFEDIFSTLTGLTDCGYFFNHGSANAKLEKCYYYNASGVEQTYNNSVGPNLFKNNKFIQNTSYMFRNNTGIVGAIPEGLFDSCKSTLLDVSSMFAGCTELTGKDLDNNVIVGVSDKWFENAVNLKTTAGFLNGCLNIASTIPEEIFVNCKNLTDTSNMFNNCRSLTGTISEKLFDYCRDKIERTNHMFYYCNSLSGRFPTGTYSTTTGVISYEKCNSTDAGALQVVAEGSVTNFDTQISYVTVTNLNSGLLGIITMDGSSYVKPVLGPITVPIQLGLLSDCTNLITVQEMFYRCETLGVGSTIPSDIFFTTSANKKYNKLTNISGLFHFTGFDQTYKDPNIPDKVYLCSANIFDKCTEVTQAANVFRVLKKMPACEIFMNMFDKQTKLVNASGMFAFTYNLTGAVTQNLFKNSLGTLENVHRLFCQCNMTNVNGAFLNGGYPNKRLKKIGSLFYSNDNLEGTSPKFWDTSLFTSIEKSEDGNRGVLTGTRVSNLANAPDDYKVTLSVYEG